MLKNVNFRPGIYISARIKIFVLALWQMNFPYKKQPLKSILIFLGIILIVRLLSFFCNESLIKVNSFFSGLLVRVSVLLPFSLGDLFYTLLILFLLILSFRILRSILRKNRLELKQNLRLLFYLLTCFYLIFHLFWGFNYYKNPIKDAFDTEKIETGELKTLAEFYLKNCRNLREIVKEDRNRIFKPDLNDSQIEIEMNKIRSRLIETYPELNFNSIEISNLKPSLYSEMFSYLGVLGYYVPFTAESQFNSKMPATKSLFTKFHETAHLWGFAPENEANFVGFMIGLNSENINFQYVANYKALKSILNKIVWEDPAYVEGFLERYSEPMKRDREFEKLIQKKYQGTSDDAFSMLNEAYLRLNNQEGLASYGKFVELLVGFHRKYPQGN